MTLALVIDLALGKTFIVRIEQPIAGLDWDAEFFKQTVLTITTEYASSSFDLYSFYTVLAPRFSFIVKL